MPWPHKARLAVAGLSIATILAATAAVAGWRHQPDNVSSQCLDRVTENLLLYVGWLTLDINDMDIINNAWDRGKAKTAMANDIRRSIRGC